MHQRRCRAAAACGEGAVCLMSSQFAAGMGGRVMPSYSFTELQVCLHCDPRCDLSIDRQKRNKNYVWQFLLHVVLKLASQTVSLCVTYCDNG